MGHHKSYIGIVCCTEHEFSPWHPMRDGTAREWRVCRVPLCAVREVREINKTK